MHELLPALHQPDPQGEGQVGGSRHGAASFCPKTLVRGRKNKKGLRLFRCIFDEKGTLHCSPIALQDVPRLREGKIGSTQNGEHEAKAIEIQSE